LDVRQLALSQVFKNFGNCCHVLRSNHHCQNTEDKMLNIQRYNVSIDATCLCVSEQVIVMYTGIIALTPLLQQISIEYNNSAMTMTI